MLFLLISSRKPRNVWQSIKCYTEAVSFCCHCQAIILGLLLEVFHLLTETHPTVWSLEVLTVEQGLCLV